jgi:hypothetical protein
VNYFTKHPASVGETYGEHLKMACSFGFAMIASGIACLIHGLVPAWFVRTGSQTVQRLHHQMVVNRRPSSSDASAL